MSKSVVVAGVIVLAVALSFGVHDIREQNRQILNELSAIRTAMETSAASKTRVALDDVGGDFLGRGDAPLTIVEFSDLQCPYCREFHATTFPQIKKEYIDPGKVRYIARDFPLDALHPLAIAAARATGCAADQGRSWDMRHAILLNNRGLDAGAFAGFAHDMHLDVGAFERCVHDTARLDARWQRDKAQASGVGISGTPSFVVGRTAPTGLEGVRITGAKSFDVFDATLKDLLRSSD